MDGRLFVLCDFRARDRGRGVAVSGLEMAQNSGRLSWSAEQVDERLRAIMAELYAQASEAAADYGMPGDYVAGANIAGFTKVAEATVALGVG